MPDMNLHNFLMTEVPLWQCKNNINSLRRRESGSFESASGVYRLEDDIADMFIFSHIDYYWMKYDFIIDQSLKSRGPESVFPDIVWDPDRSCQRLDLRVSVTDSSGGSPLGTHAPSWLKSRNGSNWQLTLKYDPFGNRHPGWWHLIDLEIYSRFLNPIKLSGY